MPRLVVIATGGTISTNRDADGVLRPARSGAQLADGLGVQVVDVLNLDSSQLTPSHWMLIETAVNTAVAEGADGIVITHGTDSMEETSLWLDLTYDGEVPVVLTGAMFSADSPEADGPGNLRDALAVAASPQARGLGALICFHGAVLAPQATYKVGGLQGFTGGVQVGTVSDGSFTLTGIKERPFLGTVTDTPRVDIVGAYPGADATAIEAFVAAGARGLVIAAMGHGNAGSMVIEGVRQAAASGVEVVITTRVSGGHTGLLYGPAHDLIQAGGVLSRGLWPSQARVLLMAALATGLPVRDAVARWG